MSFFFSFLFFFFFFKFKINKFLLLLLSSFFSPYFKSNWFVIGGVFFYLFKKDNILFRGLWWAGLLPAVLLLYWAGLLPVVLGPSVLSKGVETGTTGTQIGPACAQIMPRLPGACLR